MPTSVPVMHICVILLGGVALFGGLALTDDEVRGERERRSSYPQQQQQNQPQQPVATYQQQQQQQPQQVQAHQQQTHQKQENSHKTKKRCYQCAYSPPKTIHSRKTVHVGQQGHAGQGYGQQQEQYVSQTLHGGWDKCLGPFDHYQAKAFGVDTWDCHSGNCYVRRDPNGDVFRGCFKGEYGVDQHRYGCHYQGGSTYCFCEGELCNNGAAPQGQQH